MKFTMYADHHRVFFEGKLMPHGNFPNIKHWTMVTRRLRLPEDTMEKVRKVQEGRPDSTRALLKAIASDVDFVRDYILSTIDAHSKGRQIFWIQKPGVSDCDGQVLYKTPDGHFEFMMRAYCVIPGDEDPLQSPEEVGEVPLLDPQEVGDGP